MLVVFRLGLLCLFFGQLGKAPLRAQQVMPAFVRRLPAPPTVNLFASGATEDAQGRLWLATDEGVVRFDGRQFRVYHDPIAKKGVDYFHLATSPDGRIWCSVGRGTALAYIDPRRDQLVRVPDSTRLVREFLAQRRSTYVFADAQSNLWIGLRTRGLLKVNARTFAVEKVFTELDGAVHWITQDPKGRIWFNTFGSVYAYDPITGKLKQYSRGLGGTHLLSRVTSDSMYLNVVRVHARADGTILVGLKNEVDVIDPTTDRITRLPLMVSKFYPDQAVYHFHDDPQGNTYFQTTTACYRYTRKGELQKLEFSTLTHPVMLLYPSRSNRLWLVAGQALLEYDLSRIRPLPPLNLIDVVVNRARLDEPSDRQQLVRDSLGHPTLRVQEGDLITLRVAPAVQSNAGKLAKAFRYHIANYTDSWQARDGYEPKVMTGTSYALPAGTHRFELNKAIYPLGWEKAVSTMTIVVVPPYWKTGWFVGLVLVSLGGISYWLNRNWYRRRKLRQELARREFEAVTLRELDKLKSQFFTNITHELRTPLTIILNATEQMDQASWVELDRKRLQSVQRSAQQLIRLINETLDIAKLDAGKLDRREQVGDPVAFVGQVVEQFLGLAEHRQIRLDWKAQSAYTQVYSFDGDKVEKITYNLLSNALKFTPAEGSVQIECQIADNHALLLQVADTGIGIPQDQLSRIFDRFHQVDSSSTRAYSGTGIGLSLVKELTDWLGGTVAVESTVGRGSVFTVTLPLSPTQATDAPAVTEPRLSQHVLEPLRRPVLDAISDTAPLDEANRPLVLIVEDNEELRTYTSDHLTTYYRILTAENGRLGLELAIKEVPDLIVSDVMMPEMDGYELVERLKADERTSHIPVVLLTAKSSYDSRMKGLGAGADDYIGKPFSLAELSLRIGNCLRTRQSWQRRLMTAVQSSESAAQLANPPYDKEERFLDRLRGLILDHLTDENVDVDWLSEQAGMSRAQLHRKLTALTNTNTTRFIHSVRLSKAVHLLQTSELNVAQVAQAVGYSSQSYFTKVFQDQLGYLPMSLKQ